MRFIKEEDRSELSFQLSNMIEDDNEVRIIDAFVDKVDLISHGYSPNKQGKCFTF